MSGILIIGVILFTGFVLGELAVKVRLPKITGYILAGILLNPGIFDWLPDNLTKPTEAITNFSLCFITFSIGGSLFLPKIKKLGKGILYITLFEAEGAFLAVVAGLLLVLPFFVHGSGISYTATLIPLALLLGSLASPTDPSATLAVTHEYKAEGEVTSTIMGVSALDDALGIMNYSFAIVLAEVFVTHAKFDLYSSMVEPCLIVLGSLALGCIFGVVFNFVCRFIKKGTDGSLIVLVAALLALCFGLANIFKFDELLCTMVMGAIVVNFNPKRDRIFEILERYTEEVIFVMFFTISGMQLDFSVLSKVFGLVFLFALFRIIGKVFGTAVGATIAKSSSNVKKYTGGGLVPAGGIVIGLALLMKQHPAFNKMADIIISVIIGATVIHELIGPIIVKIVLRKAGELKKS
ncbi:MAG: cation:proton antiporter [Candidatus Omnitrophota bacterium]